MASKQLKARISLKTDDLSNWNNSTLVLNDGELAIANSPTDYKKVKLGDGAKTFSQLCSNLDADNIKTTTLIQGYAVSASNYSAAFGIHTEASGPYAVAMGNSASAPHQGAFVWNGDSTEYGINSKLSTKGAGTFTINPVNDVSGFYIGEYSLNDYLSNSVSSVSSKIDTLNSNVSTISSDVSSLSSNISTLSSDVSSISSVLSVGSNVTTTEWSLVKTNNGIVTDISVFSGGSGQTGYYLCTLTGILSDGNMVYDVPNWAVSTIPISDSSTPVIINLPQILESGIARDFIVRIEVYVNTVPQFTFSGVDENITFDGEFDWYNIQPGLNIISFTETRRLGE